MFNVAQTFLSDRNVCGIAALSACFDSAFALRKVYWSKSADRNVGDTADRNVCATRNPGFRSREGAVASNRLVVLA